MCGIIGGLSKNNQFVNKAVWKRYTHQKARGSEGFGFVIVKDGFVETYRAETEVEIKKLLDDNKSSTIMFHHRFPTSTINCVEATHPIYVSNKELECDYLVIHNGVLLNEDELRKKHTAIGYEYTTEIVETNYTDYKTKLTTYVGTEVTSITFNDSESFAIDLARFIEHKSDMLESVGSIAFMAYKIVKSGINKGKLLSIYYGHNGGNPLHIEEDNNLLFIRSVGGRELDTDTLYCLDYETGKTTEEKVAIGRERYYSPLPKTTVPTHSYSEDYKRGVMGFRLADSDDIEDRYYDYDDPQFKADNSGIISPYALNDKEEGFIKSITERWVELDEQQATWSDFAEGEQEKIASGLYDSPEELKKIIESRDDALYQVEIIEEKKQELEADFYARYGADIDLYDYIEEELYKPSQHF